MKRILAYMIMLFSVIFLVSCRMGGDKPNNDNPGTNDKPDNDNNNNDDATNDNGSDDENSDGTGDTNGMPAITGEKIEVSFSKEGYAVGRTIEVTAKIHIPEDKFFSNVDHYEVILVKGVYDALMYPEKDHKVLTTIQKGEKDQYTDITDMDNSKYYNITKSLVIPTDSINDNGDKFTIALVGLKENDKKSIISSAYVTYNYTVSGNKITIGR